MLNRTKQIVKHSMQNNNDNSLLSFGNSYWIAKLYRGAINYRPEEFRLWLFELLDSIVPIQGGVWTFKVEQAEGTFLPLDEMVCRFAKRGPELVENGEFIAKNDERLKTLSFQVSSDNHPNVIHELSLIRFVHQIGFSGIEQQLVEFLLPTIVEALHVNLLSNSKKDSSTLSDKAIVTESGQLVQASPAFVQRLQDLCLIEGGKVCLPTLTQQSGDSLLSIEPVEVCSMGRLLEIGISVKPLLRKLTNRQKQICVALVKGLSDKTIGKELSISYLTVSNHLKKIYKLFGLSDRTHAISFLHKQGF